MKVPADQILEVFRPYANPGFVALDAEQDAVFRQIPGTFGACRLPD